MRKWIVEFLSKFQGHGIKIAREFIWLALPNSLIFFNILRAINFPAIRQLSHTFHVYISCMQLYYVCSMTWWGSMTNLITMGQKLCPPRRNTHTHKKTYR